MTIMLNTTLTGQKPNSLDTGLFQRMIYRMIPAMQPQQERILQNYMEMVDANSRIKSYQSFGRRGGITTIANAIALAEGQLGNSVIFMGETDFENRSCVRQLCRFSPLEEVLLSHNVKYITPKDNIFGKRCDILIYETFFSPVNKDVVGSFQKVIATAMPVRAYMIHV